MESMAICAPENDHCGSAGEREDGKERAGLLAAEKELVTG